MIRGAGGIGDAPLIGARRIRSVLIVFLFASLLVRATILGALHERNRTGHGRLGLRKTIQKRPTTLRGSS